MGHSIHAFIAHAALLRELASRFNHVHIADVPQGFALLFVTHDFYDQVTQLDAVPMFDKEFYFLSPGLAEFGRALSDQSPVAYIETEYFGGFGTQAAMAWDKGEVVFGPMLDDTDDKVHLPLLELPINQALRRLGVLRGKSIDEFDALGLGNFRHMPDED